MEAGSRPYYNSLRFKRWERFWKQLVSYAKGPLALIAKKGYWKRLASCAYDQYVSEVDTSTSTFFIGQLNECVCVCLCCQSQTSGPVQQRD